jgi:beta-glucosidase
MREPFPERFVWGAATSSFQIEGATAEDGRGPSIWDTFCRQPGAVKGGDHGDVACDHYHRYPADVALMAALGLRAYRFSVAWPRIFPAGVGDAPLEAGLGFYDRLVDTLLAAGITPWVTLYHWDLPQPLEDQGGWAARGTVDAFVRYADVVTRRLGDRVRHWITHNEPWCVAILGYQTGLHAPGRRDPPAALAAAHHVLLSHGLAVPAIRANCPGAQVGITLNLAPAVSASDSPADRLATRRFDGHFNRWFLDPLHGRGYPEDQVEHYRERGWLPAGPPPFLLAEDLDRIATPTDFLGINYYSRAVIRSDQVPEAENAPRTVPAPPPERCTDIGWEVWPDGLYDLLTRLAREYPQPLFVTENGAAYHTGPSADGEIHDEARVAYLAGHLAAARRALRDGVDLRGYFAWSLLDNFEWQEGYSQRFGLVWVDYATQRRVPKDSARWYQAVVTSGRLP